MKYLESIIKNLQEEKEAIQKFLETDCDKIITAIINSDALLKDKEKFLRVLFPLTQAESIDIAIEVKAEGKTFYEVYKK